MKSLIFNTASLSVLFINVASKNSKNTKQNNLSNSSTNSLTTTPGTRLPKNYKFIPTKNRPCQDIFSNCPTLTKKACTNGHFGLWACPNHCNKCKRIDKPFILSDIDNEEFSEQSEVAFILLSQVEHIKELIPPKDENGEEIVCNEYQRKTKMGNCVDLNECKTNKARVGIFL